MTIQEEPVPLHRRLIQLFNAGARPLSSDALNALLQHFEGAEDVSNDRVQTILAELTVGESPTVTLEDLEPLLQRLQLHDSDDGNTVQVINSFEMPRHEWDESHKRFVRCSKPASIHAEPLAKPRVVLGRLQMLDQCVQRVTRFNAGSSSESDFQVTPVKALVGTAGTTRNVLGMVRRDITKGKVYIEDATGVAQVTNLQSADCSTALGYISDGCCMLLQGSLQPNHAFGVTAILEPFMEPREQAVASLRGLCLSGAQPLRPSVLADLHRRNYEDESQRMVFLNRCHLDDAVVLQSLAAVLHGYDGLAEGPPPVITLLGPFFKPRSGEAGAQKPTLREMTAAFEALHAAISLFPAIQAHSKIILVPAPSDPGCFGTLPQRPLPECVARPLLNGAADVVLASNPCRIQFFRKEVVIFNSPCMDAFQAHSLVQSTGEETAADDVFRAACHTMLTQRHLSPFPVTVQPMHWEYDASLALFPQPDALVVPYETLLYNTELHGVRCISPGSVKLGSFTAYIPVAPAEEDELDDDVLPETAAEASAAKAGTGASRNQSGNTQPNNQDDEMAAERLSEFREGGALTRGAGGGGHRLGGAGGGTTPLPDIVTADAGMEDTGADRGAATGAGKADVEVRGCLVEECEVPIEAAAEDKGSEHDSDSDLDPDRFDGHSGDEGPIGREALDSEEDDFDAQPYSPEGRSGDVLDASDDDDALFVAFDDAIARKDKPAQGSQDKDRMEEGLEDEDLEDEDV